MSPNPDAGPAAGVSPIAPDARRPFIIAGPCVIEEEAMALRVAETAAREARRHGLTYVFKSSYLKDNRTSAGAYTGPGLEEGLRILRRVRAEVGVPVLTDVHTAEEAAAAAEVVDVLQVPAFLCRQGRLLRACGRTGKAVNVKKGQFLAPADMAHAVAKIREVHPGADIWLTERGTAFGYRDLVVDMRAVALMRGLGGRVVFDATHSLQHPGAGGDRRFAASLARAALGAGAEGIFAEIHPDPARARCDASTQLPLAQLGTWMEQWARLGALITELERQDPPLGEGRWPGLETRGPGDDGGAGA